MSMTRPSVTVRCDCCQVAVSTNLLNEGICGQFTVDGIEAALIAAGWETRGRHHLCPSCRDGFIASTKEYRV